MEKIKEAITQLRMAMVASCSCMTKTPDPSSHTDSCHYRTYNEIHDLLMDTLRSSTELRTYILIRDDLEISPGKLGVQAAHAAVGTYQECLKIWPIIAHLYEEDPKHAKIALQASAETIMSLFTDCEGIIPCHLVTDLGLTEFDGPTITCLGIGPISKHDAEKRLNMKSFPLYRK